MEVIQNSFGGGINTLALDTKVQDDSCVWGVNIRTRYSDVSPINKHLEIDLPSGVTHLQGSIGVGNILVLFANGRAYFKQEDADTGWQAIPAFQMSATARKYWLCAVPASNMNFVRKLNENANIKADILVTTDFKVAGTPAAIVVQDGINQPWLVIYDTVNQIFTARQAKTYSLWNNKSVTNDDREYVPRGKQMFYKNGVLFIVSIDGKKIYRSVSYRPLDFVINVDTNGNKAASEAEGGADKLSFAFDFDIITGIHDVNVPNAFVYTTKRYVRVIVMDYTSTLFGEPTFYEASKIEAGVVNENSFIDILGDYAFVDKEGIISFNAVEQMQQNGRNSIFSLNVSKFFEGIKQTNPFCFYISNYAIFNVNSIWGNVMLVYDTLLEKWISIDITDVTNLKSVAYVETTAKSYVYVVTEHNELFKLFGKTTEFYLAQVRTKAHMPAASNTEHKTSVFRPRFKGGKAESAATVIEYVDDVEGQRINQTLNNSLSSIKYPIRPPVIPHTVKQIDNPQYTLNQGVTGSKIHFIIQWQSDARLFEYLFTSTEQTKNTSVVQGNSYLV